MASSNPLDTLYLQRNQRANRRLSLPKQSDDRPFSQMSQTPQAAFGGFEGSKMEKVNEGSKDKRANERLSMGWRQTHWEELNGGPSQISLSENEKRDYFKGVRSEENALLRSGLNRENYQRSRRQQPSQSRNFPNGWISEKDGRCFELPTKPERDSGADSLIFSQNYIDHLKAKHSKQLKDQEERSEKALAQMEQVIREKEEKITRLREKGKLLKRTLKEREKELKERIKKDDHAKSLSEQEEQYENRISELISELNEFKRGMARAPSENKNSSLSKGLVLSKEKQSREIDGSVRDSQTASLESRVKQLEERLWESQESKRNEVAALKKALESQKGSKNQRRSQTAEE